MKLKFKYYIVKHIAKLKILSRKEIGMLNLDYKLG